MMNSTEFRSPLDVSASLPDASLHVTSPAGERSLWLQLPAIFLLLTLLSWTGIDLTRHSQGVATIWLTNGLLFAIVVRQPRSRWLAYLAVGLTADIVADVVWGDPWQVAVGVSLLNSLEVFLSSLLLTRFFGLPFNFMDRRSLLGFLGIAVTFTTAITSALGAMWTRLFLHPGPWLRVFRIWYLGDVLGMALVAPLVFVLQRPDFFAMLTRKRLPGSLPILAAPALVTFLVFSVSNDSLLFLILPALLYVVFRLGLPGAVFALAFIATISISMTVCGHGPLAHHSTGSIPHGIAIVQIFIAVALFTCFPVAAILEERLALSLSLMQSENKYRVLATTDPLTGQLNRRSFDEHLQQEWQRAATERLPFTLFCLDVDSFKAYNDIYGHIAGDVCLRSIASLVAETLLENAGGYLYRLGGEEFAVLLPHQEGVAPFALAERIRSGVCNAALLHAGNTFGRQTISIGLATTIPDVDCDPISLLNMADQALYRAKANGRNRCEISPDAPTGPHPPRLRII